jgi:Ser/Thr protein kinase RdoA (MazF antagonist)
MNTEIPLGGGAMTGSVVRVGDTVRRPAGPAAERMRDVLLRLERAGFDAAPRWLGVDDRGRDVLTWIEGETITDRGRVHPYIDDSAIHLTFTESQVAGAMRLLRRYHDCFAGEVVCHGDFGPWNLVWRDDLPAAIIDFDNVHPGEAAEDVAYALRAFVGYGLSDAHPPELVHLTKAALAAYGATFDVPAIVEREYDLAVERCRRNGWTRQLEKLSLERAWMASNRGLFLGGFCE